MKKFSLKELESLLPVMNLQEQNAIVGGGFGTLSSPYTISEYLTMVGKGTWRGGYVEGFSQYVGQNSNTFGQSYNGSFYGSYGGNGTWQNPFSLYQFMFWYGYWGGGYVYGLGYVPREVVVYGSKSYYGYSYNSYSSYYTFGNDYASSSIYYASSGGYYNCDNTTGVTDQLTLSYNQLCDLSFPIGRLNKLIWEILKIIPGAGFVLPHLDSTLNGQLNSLKYMIAPNVDTTRSIILTARCDIIGDSVVSRMSLTYTDKDSHRQVTKTNEK